MRLAKWWSISLLLPVAVALSGCGTQAPPAPTQLAVTTFEAADTVIGQPDFTSNSVATSQTGLDYPGGDPALVNGVFYAPDSANNRVLGYLSGIPTSNGEVADFVLGQPDFGSHQTSSAATGLNWPQTVFGAAGKLFVTDYGNNRVLIWNTPPTTTEAAADIVVGQGGFGTSTRGCTASAMHYPQSATATSSKLIVADTSNNRVLIYNSIPSSNGATADIVLGQADFTHCSANEGSASPTASTLYFPSDVWTDGTKLIVADSDNNRVLIWNTFPTSNDQPADIVIGQPDMLSNASASGANGMKYPYFLTSNGLQLFVADSDNNRVLVFNTIPTGNGASADIVLGQSDFTHTTSNDDNQDGTADATPSDRTMYYPIGLLVTSNALVVADDMNIRYLVFRP